MTLLEWIGLGIAAALGTAVALFRPGGKYNPKMPSLDNLDPETPYIPASPPPIMAPPAPKTPPDESKPPTQPFPTLEKFMTLIRDFEGKPGDQNYRLNNPGNFRFSRIGYMPIYGIVKESQNGFAIFKDAATGWLYMKNAIKSIIHNNPNLTIYTFIAGDETLGALGERWGGYLAIAGEEKELSFGWDGYSPASDNNPVNNYANYLAKGLGVDILFLVKNLV